MHALPAAPHARAQHTLNRRMLCSAGFCEATKVATLAPHDDAVSPRCPHFGPCGGCSLQSLEYDAGLRHKVEHVAQLFARVGRLDAAAVAAARQPPLAAPAEQRYGYRNKVQLAFSTRVWQQGQPGVDASEPPQAAGGAASERAHAAADASWPDGGRVVQGWGLGYLMPASSSVVMPVQHCSLAVSAWESQGVQCTAGLCACAVLPDVRVHAGCRGRQQGAARVGAAAAHAC